MESSEPANLALRIDKSCAANSFSCAGADRRRGSKYWIASSSSSFCAARTKPITVPRGVSRPNPSGSLGELVDADAEDAADRTDVVCARAAIAVNNSAAVQNAFAEINLGGKLAVAIPVSNASQPDDP